jgi:hypothetical protein
MQSPAYTIQLYVDFQRSAPSPGSQLRQPNIGHEESLQNHIAQLFTQLQAIRDAVGLAHARSVCTSIQTSNRANDKYEPPRRFLFARATRFIAISQPFDLPELLE